MDKLEYYRTTIEEILTGYYEMAIAGDSCFDTGYDRLAFDRQRDQYLWFRSGWEDNRRIQNITIYIRIHNDKIWVEEDSTNLCVVDDLLEAGIPKIDLVLGFHHPSKRTLTEFAIG